MTARRLALAAALLAAIASCGNDDGSTIGGRCLSEADICQFVNNVSTKQQVQAALGKPYISQSVSNGGATIEQWIYVCMPDAQSIQQVQFVFDGNGILIMRLVSSSGPNAPPAPTCQ